VRARLNAWDYITFGYVPGITIGRAANLLVVIAALARGPGAGIGAKGVQSARANKRMGVAESAAEG